MISGNALARGLRRLALAGMAATSALAAGPGPQVHLLPLSPYGSGKQYVYAFDTTCDTTIYGSSNGTVPQTTGQTKSSRVMGTLRLTPLQTTADSTILAATVDSGTSVYAKDDTGNWVQQSVDTSLLQEPCLIEQGFDGKVRSARFKPMSISASDTVSYNRVQSARNILKGLVSMLDFRMIAPSTTLSVTDGVDSTGHFNATYTRGTGSQIQINKTTYTSFAPGMGIYGVRGDTYTPADQAWVQASSTGSATLDSSGMVTQRTYSDTFTVVSTSNEAPPASSTFNPTGTAVINGTLNRTSVGSGDPSTFSLADFKDTQDLTAQVCCETISNAWRSQATADAEVQAALTRIQQDAVKLGGANQLAQALQHGGDITPIRTAVMTASTDPAQARAMLMALGIAPTVPARAVLRDFLNAAQMPDETTCQAILSVSSAPHPESDLIAAVQHVADTRSFEVASMANQALGLMASAIATIRPEESRRITDRLVAKLAGARSPREYAACLRAVGNTRSAAVAGLLRAVAQGGHPVFAPIAEAGIRKQLQPMVPFADRDQIPVRHWGSQLVSGGSAIQPRFVTKDNWCNQFASSLPYTTDSQHFACEGRSESAGSAWLGGAIYAYYGAGVNSDKTIADFEMGTGLDAYLLKIPIPFAQGKVTAHYDATDSSNSKLTYSFGWLGSDSQYSGTLDLDDEIPDDPNYASIRKPFFNQGYQYRVCGQIWIFTVCFGAGVGAESGVDFRFGGFKGLNATNGDNDPTVFIKAGPYAEVNAYLEGSIGFFCLDLALRLEGDFLNVSFPIRMDLDPKGTNQTSANLYLSADEQIIPWELRLYGRFDYCFDSYTKLLWRDTAAAQTIPLYTHVMNPPDLQVTALTTQPGLSLIDTSAPLKATVSIKNIGSGTTPPTRPLVGTVTLPGTNLSATFTSYLQNGVVPRRLRPTETFTTTVKLSPLVAGNFNLTATANPASQGKAQIPEADFPSEALPQTPPANNVKVLPITVKPAYPDLVVKSAVVTAPTTVLGDTVTMQIAPGNLGPGGDPMKVTMVYDPDLGKMVPDPEPVPIQMRVLYGSTVLATTSAIIGDLPATVQFSSNLNGVWIKSVSVDVDGANAITEKDETNNRMDNIVLTRADSAVPVVTVSGGGTLIDAIAHTRDMEYHTFSISVTEDSRIDRLEYLVDGVVVYATRTVPSAGSFATAFYYQTLAPDYAEGAHTFQARATDQSGKVGTSNQISFNVHHPDLTPPTGVAKIVDLNGTLYLLATQLKDTSGPIQSGVSKVDFYFDNKLVKTVALPFFSSSTAGGVLRCTIPNDGTMASGLHSLSIKVYDSEANWAWGQPATWTKDKSLQEVEANASLGLTDNNTLATAQTVYSYTRIVSGFMGANDLDFFKVQIPAGASCTYQMDGDDAFGFELVNASGAVLAGSATGTVSTINYTNTTGAPLTLYLRVNSYKVYDPDYGGNLPIFGNYGIEITPH